MSETASSDPNDWDLRTPLLPPAKYPDGDSKHEKLCIDDMLQKYCGEFGFWQLRHFILASLAWALEAFQTMVVIFADREPGWRCLDGGGPGSGCYPEAISVCELEPGSWEWIGGPGSSTVDEFGLVCGQKYKIGLVQALFFGGCMIGAGVFGHLSDSRLGRKSSLLVVCILNTIFGCLTAISPDYKIHVDRPQGAQVKELKSLPGQKQSLLAPPRCLEMWHCPAIKCFYVRGLVPDWKPLTSC